MSATAQSNQSNVTTDEAISDEMAAQATAEVGQTDVNVTRDDTSHEVTSIHGTQVTYDANDSQRTSVRGTWPESADSHVRGLIREAIIAREQRENARANHRNFNRMLTLMGALIIGLAVTYTLEHGGVPQFGWKLPAWAPGLAPYSFVITVALDSLLALYSFIRHY